MSFSDNVNRNLINANNRQGVAYQKNSVQGNSIGYFKQLTDLLPQALQNSTNKSRNILFDIPGGFGASPGPLGVAGSATVNAISKPPIIGVTTYAGS